MVMIRLPDGNTKEYPSKSRPKDIALAIGKRLADAAVAAKVNGSIVDLDRELPDDSTPLDFQLLTDRDREALDVLRHSCAHVMARAVMRLYPGVKLAFGPTTENGFYYDIDCDPPIKEDDFPKIEEEMAKICKDAEPFERFERNPSESKELMEHLDQTYKVEHIKEGLKGYEHLSFYRQGEFIDLCRGPHIPHAGKIAAFKLLSIAGAYWKNDATRPQLQRLYGTAFFNKKEMDAYLSQVEEAKKRDHRVLGKQLKLFTISQAVGSGLILWMPKGATVRGILETFIKEELIKRGYSPVYTPNIGRLELYRTSGHFPYYRDAQYPPLFLHPLGQCIDTWLTQLEQNNLRPDQEAAFLELATAHQLEIKDYDPDADPDKRKAALRTWVEAQEGYLVKPMNCPHHIQIYKATPHSYRDLPVRLAEFGTVYRFEQTGELSGMTRVRGFTQDDAHLFCTDDQVGDEFKGCIEMTQMILRTMGLNDYRVRLSFRDPRSDKYVGKPESWDRAERVIEEVARAIPDLKNIDIAIGEAAFYGPKVDFIVKDCIGREWQLGTVQLDYNLPERFALEYTGADNQQHRPAMIHRAPFGSMERFLGILIEHFAGAFPLWMAPEQGRVLPVSEKSALYAHDIVKKFSQAGYRVTGDFRPEKIGYKIREAQLEKIPYMLVVGEKEVTTGTIAVRDRVDGELGPKPIDEVLALFEAEVIRKSIRSTNSASVDFTEKGAKFGE
jgi:threonyl-tRNA synthetase